jgi:hypothetical protein
MAGTACEEIRRRHQIHWDSYSTNSLAVNNTVNSLDMGGIQDGAASGCNSTCQQNYVITNNGQTLNSIPFFLGDSQSTFPLTVTLGNGNLYAESIYSNTNMIVMNTQQFVGFTENDAFVIGDSAYYAGGSWWNTDSKFHWFRTRTPPPNNIFPVANTV